MDSNIIEPCNNEELINAVDNGEPIFESLNGREIKKSKLDEYSEYARKDFR